MTDGFFAEMECHPLEAVSRNMAACTENDVLRALKTAESGVRLHEQEFMALLSPAATQHLERMAQIAQRVTLRNFGRAVQLFTPLYLSNFCSNRCVYCGFNTENAIRRSMLSPEEIEAEGACIAATGLRHILLLTGDAPQKAGPDYIADAARRLRAFFPGIGIEVYSLTEKEYQLLREAGVDSMTMFQETYNPELYAQLHPSGPKRDFLFRLNAPGRAAAAGMRCVNIGALLGLDEWRRDTFFTGLHANWLQERYPGVETAVSVPRMRPHAGAFDRVRPVSDRDLVQIILALRLFLPMSGITVSTRERPGLREHLVPLGVTKLSAGVSTAVGGHVPAAKGGQNQQSTAPFAAPHTRVAECAISECARQVQGSKQKVGQFEIADTRSVDEVAAAIRSMGYQPVFKHWEPLDGAAYTHGTPRQ